MAIMTEAIEQNREAEWAKERAREAQRQLSYFRYVQDQSGIPFRYRKAELADMLVETPAQAEILRVAKSFVESGGVNPSGLICIGTLGSGKTHLANAVANAFLRSGKRQTVRYITPAGLTRHLRSSWHSKTETEEQAFNRLAKTNLVILDELGAQAGTDAELATLTSLLDARYGAQKPTILIGNLTMPELAALLGERILDRLKQGATVLPFDWPSRRPSFQDVDEGPEPPIYHVPIT